ncbi:hypothetical protein GZL_02514 [Streptomyces sp. 769]|nr:hypothetical protein GZL_02514 [Streptomyces sp. 769]
MLALMLVPLPGAMTARPRWLASPATSGWYPSQGR